MCTNAAFPGFDSSTQSERLSLISGIHYSAPTADDSIQSLWSKLAHEERSELPGKSDPGSPFSRAHTASRSPVVTMLPERQRRSETPNKVSTERRTNIGNFQRVIVAEQHSATRQMLLQMLRHWGFEAMAAETGAEVLQIIDRSRPPELIIMSQNLPGIDTVELCRQISNRHIEYSPYILMLAIQNDKRQLVRALESGAAEYLTTPFEAKELRARLIVATRIVKRQQCLLASREQFRVLATKDSLTGIWNRRSIHEILDTELDGAAHSERSTGVLLVDLDHFKRVNDTHGHLVGDLVLRETSQRLRNVLRQYDSIGRYGGEEFLIVVPGSLEGELCDLAERLRLAVAADPIRIGETELRITLSIGAAIVPPHAKMPASVLAIADEALYDAKRFGRNRVCMGAQQSSLFISSPAKRVNT